MRRSWEGAAHESVEHSGVNILRVLPLPTYVHSGPVLNEFGNGIRVYTHTLEIHLVMALPSTLWGKMVDGRCGVQVQLLEDLWRVLIVDNSEVDILSVKVRVAVRIRHNQKLLVNGPE